MGECLEGNRQFAPGKEIEDSSKEKRKLEQGDRGGYAPKMDQSAKRVEGISIFS